MVGWMKAQEMETDTRRKDVETEQSRLTNSSENYSQGRRYPMLARIRERGPKTEIIGCYPGAGVEGMDGFCCSGGTEREEGLNFSRKNPYPMFFFPFLCSFLRRS